MAAPPEPMDQSVPPPLRARLTVLDLLSRGTGGEVLRCHDRELDRGAGDLAPAAAGGARRAGGGGAAASGELHGAAGLNAPGTWSW